MSAVAVGVRVVIGGRPGFWAARGEGRAWHLPGGGIRPRERLGEAARRLAREQTGLEILLADLTGIYETGGDSDVRGLYFVFRASDVGGRAAPGPGIRELRKFTTAELRALPREDLAEPDLLLPVLEDLDLGTAWPLAVLR